jgi:hypothetical protein
MANKTSEYLKEAKENNEYYKLTYGEYGEYGEYEDNEVDKDKNLSAFQRRLREEYAKPGGEAAYELSRIYMNPGDDEFDRYCGDDDYDGNDDDYDGDDDDEYVK